MKARRFPVGCCAGCRKSRRLVAPIASGESYCEPCAIALILEFR